MSSLSHAFALYIFFVSLSSSIHSTCPNHMSIMHLDDDTFLQTCLSANLLRYLSIRSAKVTPHNLDRNRISTAFTLHSRIPTSAPVARCTLLVVLFVERFGFSANRLKHH